MILTILSILAALFFLGPIVLIAGAFLVLLTMEIWDKFWSPLLHGRLPWG